MVDQLLAAGADAMTSDVFGRTAVHAAVRGESSIVLSKILKIVPGSVDIQDSRGQSPLYVAAQTGRQEAVELLLQSGRRTILRLLFSS